MGSYPWGPHGPQVGPNQVTPNPTPAYVPPAPTPSYSPQPVAPSYSGGPVQNTNIGYVGPIGPRKKHYFLAIFLTLLFGPLGLFYASKKGALTMLFLLFAVPIALGMIGFYPIATRTNPFIVLQFDSIMNPMYRVCVFFCVMWSVVSVWCVQAQRCRQSGGSTIRAHPGVRVAGLTTRSEFSVCFVATRNLADHAHHDQANQNNQGHEQQNFAGFIARSKLNFDTLGRRFHWHPRRIADVSARWIAGRNRDGSVAQSPNVVRDTDGSNRDRGSQQKLMRRVRLPRSASPSVSLSAGNRTDQTGAAVRYISELVIPLP